MDLLLELIQLRLVINDKIKIFSRFFCYSLWRIYDDGSIDNISPNDIPISSKLKLDITSWESEYDSIFNDDYPVEPKFNSKQEEDNFFKKGYELYYRLLSELPKEYSVDIGWK